MSIPFWLTFIGAILSGLLAGASLDQSIKQLPARRKMGVLAYTKYSQASDLGSGIAFYAILGIGAALVTIIAAITAYATQATDINTIALYLAALLAILHSFVTMQAAPTNFSQKKVDTDEKALVKVFNKFEKLQTVRCIFQVATFILLLFAIIMSKV